MDFLITRLWLFDVALLVTFSIVRLVTGWWPSQPPGLARLDGILWLLLLFAQLLFFGSPDVVFRTILRGSLPDPVLVSLTFCLTLWSVSESVMLLRTAVIPAVSPLVRSWKGAADGVRRASRLVDRLQ
ncbi:hypothetical protein [Thermorudis peleae]|uniref:hypothetical protein n=1 Tax=Thermorudis peleae TaxID=1382356 RepID=UPI00057016FD|nr:hypothetical protein [Thermorudis peleae]MBX6752961.1 hypothetical protein [Thermorudis peleae]